MIPGSANPLLLGQTGTDDFSIERSLRFNSGDSAYLNRTPGSAGNRKTWTLSFWVKLCGTSGHLISAGNDAFQIELRSDGQYLIANSGCFSNTYSTAVFRDYSAWQHFVIEHDATNTYCKIYVNGSLQKTITASNANGAFNNNTAHNFNGRSTSLDSFTDFYLAEVNFIDGTALDPTSFGQADANGVWQSKNTAGLTFGTNGFRLKFADNSSSSALGADSSGNSNSWTVNNLSASAPGLATANQGMDVVTYSGNSTARNIDGLAFAPDLVIIKSRSNSGYNHYWVDSVRGTNKNLYSNSTEADHTADRLSSFNSNGFGLTNHDGVNSSGKTYVAWAWKAGGAASSNTDGTITSSVSVNTTYGFSIVSYTGNNTSGATVGHGLGSDVKFLIVKSRNQAQYWHVWHSSLANNEYIYLNANNAKTSGNDFLNGTAPGSSTFTLGNGNACNKSSDPVIAYCWSEVAGFSKFGSYTGNGSANGPVITTGFRPRWIMVKGSTNARHWDIMDSARSPTNPQQNTLRADSNGAEFSDTSSAYGIVWEVTDTGFKILRGGSNHDINTSGETYIYAAFAAKPDQSAIDSLVDTPNNAAEPTDTGVGNEVVGNYATINPLDNPGQAPYGNQAATISNGNLDFAATGNFYAMRRATIQVPSSGKWYMECTVNGTGYSPRGVSSQASGLGLCKSNVTTAGNAPITDVNTLWLGDSGYGKLFGSTTRTEWKAADIDEGDIISLAVDMDASTFNFRVNNVSVQNGSINTTDPVTPFVFSSSTSYTNLSVNFGQRAFSFSAPTNFKSLNTASLPTPTIADGSKYFNAQVYSGSSGTKTITTTFAPGLVWIKNRGQTRWHSLFDVVRGPFKRIFSNTPNAETNDVNYNLNSFTGTGYTLLDTDRDTNSSNGDSYISWAWDGGSSNTTIAAGGLNSSVYNQSQTWSSGTAGGTGSFTPAITTLFDGDISTGPSASSGTSPEFTFTTPISFSTKVELYSSNGSGTGYNNGGTNSNAYFALKSNGSWHTVNGAGSQWIDVTALLTTNIQGLKINVPSGWGSGGLKALRIDGKVLVNSGVTPPNVPTIASTVRANPSAGFSIVTYTGTGANASVGHGLNDEPHLIFTKNRDASNYGWYTYAKAIGNDKYLVLEDTTAASSFNLWQNTTATSSVFYLSSNAAVMQNNADYVAYCFSSVAGYSVMGSYTGTGGSNFIFTGMAVAWVLIKRTSGADNWFIYDAARDTTNARSAVLRPNLSNAELTSSITLDFLSNGFSMNTSDSGINASGQTYIYYAVAENPFQANGGLAR